MDPTKDRRTMASEDISSNGADQRADFICREALKRRGYWPVGSPRPTFQLVLFLPWIKLGGTWARAGTFSLFGADLSVEKEKTQRVPGIFGRQDDLRR